MLVSEKKKKERIELLLSNIRVHKKLENGALDLINKKEGDPLACMRSNGSLYEFKASECLIFNKDIETFKQYIYIC